MLDSLSQEIRVGDICLIPCNDTGDYSRMSLEPVLITNLEDRGGSEFESSFLISFVYRSDRLEERFVLKGRRVDSLVKIANPEFYLHDSRVANLTLIRQDILSGGRFQVKLPLF